MRETRPFLWNGKKDPSKRLRNARGVGDDEDRQKIIAQNGDRVLKTPLEKHRGVNDFCRKEKKIQMHGNLLKTIKTVDVFSFK